MHALTSPLHQASGRRLSRRTAVGLITATVAAALAGCAGPADPNQPPSIQLGRDVCTRCGMIISDAAFAAAYRTESGDARIFCDIGELPQYLREQSERPAASFASDYEAKQLVRAEKLHFVRSTSLQTPMGTGIAAFEQEPAAQTLASRTGGQVIGFEELLTLTMPMRGGMQGGMQGGPMQH